jgi:AraC family transcriptional regulator, transcriptional activator of pobA
MQSRFPVYHIGHFINAPDNPTALELTRFETMQEPDVDDIHMHHFYEIIWVEEGECVQTIDYQTYRLPAGTLFFISPGQVHSFEAWQGLRGGSLFFTADFLLLNQQDQEKLFELTFLDNFHARPFLQPDPAAWSEILHSIELLAREKARPDAAQPILHALLQVILAQVQRCVTRQQTQPPPRRALLLYKHYKTLIDQHYKTDKGVSAYADLLCVTQHHLNLVAQQVAGRSASGLIRARRMLEAKRWLSFTDRSVTEIADDLGYFDSSFFAKQFKAETGVSPSGFRVEMSEKYRNSSFES